MSWAARRKMVRLVVDDMMASAAANGQVHDESAIEAMQKAEKELKVMPRLAAAMIAGRLYGSGVSCWCIRLAALATWPNRSSPKKSKRAALPT